MTDSSFVRRLARIAACSVTTGLIAALAPAATAAPRETPAVGTCFYAVDEALEGMSLALAPVDCAEPHTLETYLVATWTFADPYTMDEDMLGQRAEKLCAPIKADRYLGIPATRAPLSRSYWYFFFPTEQQWDEGERWIRCDVGLQRGWEGVQVISGRMADLIAQQGVRAWAWCTKSRPAKYDLQAPVPCSSANKPWVLVTSTQLKGSTYPGNEQVQRQSKAFCSRAAEREARVPRPEWYVWWSSEQEWKSNRAGFAYCYMSWAQSRWT